MKHVLFFLCAVLLLPSCGDQVQKAKPPAQPAPRGAMPPDHPEIGHGAASRAGEDPFADHGPTSRVAMNAAAPTDPERVVFAGEIAVDPAVPLGDHYTLYLTTVYAPQERVGVLIHKYDTPKFPLKFELREKDAIMGSRSSDKPLFLRAMISDTGDVMKSRNRTTSDQAYPIFTKDIKLTIKP